MSEMSRYINPYTDFGFKKLFGEEANKDLLIDFLNAVLPEKYRISSLEFRNTEQQPNHLTARRAVFDITCVSENGEYFIVEMQKAKQLFFKHRALYDVTFPIQQQAPKGGDWNFELKTTFLVAVLDFLYDEKVERGKLYRTVDLKDQDGEVFLEAVQFVFLQMPLFNKKESELETHTDKWYYFLKNLPSLDEIPAILKEPVFEKAFGIAEYLHYSPLQQEVYRKDLMNYWDGFAVDQTARNDGYNEGKADGITEGKAEGIADVARNMKAEGLSAALIAKMTGLTVAEVENLD